MDKFWVSVEQALLLGFTKFTKYRSAHAIRDKMKSRAISEHRIGTGFYWVF